MGRVAKPRPAGATAATTPAAAAIAATVRAVASALAIALSASGAAFAQSAPGAPSTSPAAPVTRFSLPFVTHAAFFSETTGQTPALDPQVFVRDDPAPEGIGPQNIAHGVGLRPARLDDVKSLPAYAAGGDALGFSLERWFGAAGSVEVAPAGQGARLTFDFKNLIAFGVYSLFRVTFAAGGTTFRPLDGDGVTNTLVATVDGRANLVVGTPAPLTHADAVVLVYHSDARDHAQSRGEIGVTAHQQLIVRMP